MKEFSTFPPPPSVANRPPATPKKNPESHLKEKGISPEEIQGRIQEIRKNEPKETWPQIQKQLEEFRAMKILEDYYVNKEPKDPSGLPPEVREMMTERELDYHDYLVSAFIEWVEKFEPWFDLLDQYKDWTPDQVQQVIEGLN